MRGAFWQQREYWKDPALKDAILGPLDADPSPGGSATSAAPPRNDACKVSVRNDSSTDNSGEVLSGGRVGAFRPDWQPSQAPQSEGETTSTTPPPRSVLLPLRRDDVSRPSRAIVTRPWVTPQPPEGTASSAVSSSKVWQRLRSWVIPRKSGVDDGGSVPLHRGGGGSDSGFPTVVVVAAAGGVSRKGSVSTGGEGVSKGGLGKRVSNSSNVTVSSPGGHLALCECPNDIASRYDESSLSKRSHLLCLILTLILFCQLGSVVCSFIGHPLWTAAQAYQLCSLLILFNAYWIETFMSPTRRLLSLLRHSPLLDQVVRRVVITSPVVTYGATCWHLARSEVFGINVLTGTNEQLLQQCRINTFSQTETLEYQVCRDASDSLEIFESEGSRTMQRREADPDEAFHSDTEDAYKIKQPVTAEHQYLKPLVESPVVPFTPTPATPLDSNPASAIVILQIQLSCHLLDLDTEERVRDLRERLRDACRWRDGYLDEERSIRLPGLPMLTRLGKQKIAPLICRGGVGHTAGAGGGSGFSSGLYARLLGRRRGEASEMHHGGECVDERRSRRGLEWLSLTMYFIMAACLLSWPYRILVDTHIIYRVWKVRKLISIQSSSSNVPSKRHNSPA